jgi:hypothetical protein
MPRYDTGQFEPPAPLTRVILRNPNTGSTNSDVPMLLDTGADVSLIPRTSLKILDLITSQDRLYELKSFDGSTSYASVVQIELIFCNRTFRGQFLVINQAWGILGRNVLNSLSLVFDGPNLSRDEKRFG